MKLKKGTKNYIKYLSRINFDYCVKLSIVLEISNKGQFSLLNKKSLITWYHPLSHNKCFSLEPQTTPFSSLFEWR